MNKISPEREKRVMLHRATHLRCIILIVCVKEAQTNYINIIITSYKNYSNHNHSHNKYIFYHELEYECEMKGAS